MWWSNITNHILQSRLHAIFEDVVEWTVVILCSLGTWEMIDHEKKKTKPKTTKTNSQNKAIFTNHIDVHMRLKHRNHSNMSSNRNYQGSVHHVMLLFQVWSALIYLRDQVLHLAPRRQAAWPYAALGQRKDGKKNFLKRQHLFSHLCKRRQGRGVIALSLLGILNSLLKIRRKKRTRLWKMKDVV